MMSEVTKEDQLEALNESIQHWEDNLQRALNNEELLFGSENCACCAITTINPGECDGCPIYEISGRGHCEGTPYYQVVEAFEEVFFGGEEDMVEELINAVKSMIGCLKDIKTKLEAAPSTEAQDQDQVLSLAC